MSPDRRPGSGPDIASQYEPRQVEDILYDQWVSRGYFTADVTSDKPPFSLVIPPPNVTGSLHLGHALEQTLMDALLRRRRMLGDEVLWLPGMDHAGIATQVLVEKHLAETEGKSRHDVGREDFVARHLSRRSPDRVGDRHARALPPARHLRRAGGSPQPLHRFASELDAIVGYR